MPASFRTAAPACPLPSRLLRSAGASSPLPRRAVPPPTSPPLPCSTHHRARPALVAAATARVRPGAPRLRPSLLPSASLSGDCREAPRSRPALCPQGTRRPGPAARRSWPALPSTSPASGAPLLPGGLALPRLPGRARPRAGAPEPHRGRPHARIGLWPTDKGALAPEGKKKRKEKEKEN